MTKFFIALINPTQAPANVGHAPANVIGSTQDVQDLFCTAVLWMFWALLVTSIIMFLVGGFMYVTAAGNPERVGKANKTLLYAAIGVAVAILARGIPLVIGSFFGVDQASLTACSGNL